MPVSSICDELIDSARALATNVGRLSFRPLVTHVYNPLDYAWAAHEIYLRKFGGSRKRVVFLGMNPGPYGMAQTGVPFGEILAVRDWMRISAPVGRPEPEHPKRPVEGFACPRREVSGQRLWGLFAARFGSAEEFFAGHMVMNYCPLTFLEASGRNRTPEQLPAAETARLFEVCDRHLRRALEILQPDWIIGVGAFAANRAQRVADGQAVRVGQILHPSPASPAANRDWAGTATRQLVDLGVWTETLLSPRSRPRPRANIRGGGRGRVQVAQA